MDTRNRRDQSLSCGVPEDRPQVIDDGYLLGFNQPSPAKYLFRAYCGHPRQPWPRTHPDLERHSHGIASFLHELLTKITRELCRHRDPLCMSSVPLASADCLPSERDPTSCGRFGTAYPMPTADPSGCPLDYFFYHNRQPHIINCSGHVDRGLLIAICLTEVPGLEILLPTLGRDGFAWYCPEEEYASRVFRSCREDSLYMDRYFVRRFSPEVLPRGRDPGLCSRRPISISRRKVVHQLRASSQDPRLTLGLHMGIISFN